jgi:hypothetical protein
MWLNRLCWLLSVRPLLSHAVCRSLQGSTRVSYSEAPGTPTGSCLGGTPLATSAPGSNISSAPNSGRDTGHIALAAAAAAGAAAASAAAAAVALRQAVDDSGVPYGNPQQTGAGFGQGWRGVAGSAPGTPTVLGAGGAAGSSAAQGPVGSAPTSGNSYSSGGSSKSSGSAAHQAEPGGSAGPLPLPNSELSFAMRTAPGLGGSGSAGGVGGGSGGATSPNVPARTPSRLGPSRCSSTIASPTAVHCGMAPLHESDGVPLSGAQQQQYLQAQLSQQQQHLAHTGSRLRRLSWGTLEGSLQSSSSKQLGLQASRASWGGSLVHEYSPTGSPLAGDRPCSPFANAAQGSDATPGSPRSPFSKMQQQQQQGGFSPRVSCAAQAAAAAAATAGAVVSHFAASQSGGDKQGKGAPAAAAARLQAPARPYSPFAAAQQPVAEADLATGQAPGITAALQSPARPYSPFAAAQQPPAEADVATCQAPGVGAALRSPTRPYSPFAAAQQLNSAACDAGHSPNAVHGINSSPASRQGTDDSTVAATQPPARPTSPFTAAQASGVREQGSQGPLAGTSGFAPGAASAANAAGGGGIGGTAARPYSPFSAVQGLGPHAAAEPGKKMQQPARLSAVAAARPASPFAAVQQAPNASDTLPDLQGPQTEAAGGRVASMTGSGFATAPHHLLAFASSGGSSQGSCSAGGATHGRSRFGGAADAAAASPFAAAAAAGGAAGAWQPNDPQVLGELQQLLLQQQQQGPSSQAQPGEQQGRASPFASVQATAVQGPIVAQQAKAVLSRLNSQAAEPQASSQQEQQELQTPAVARGVDAAGPNVGMPGGMPESSSSSGGCRPSAIAAVAEDSDAPLPPLPSFSTGAAGQQQHGLVHRSSAGAAAAATAGPAGQGSPICSGEFALSGDSITFPSGLGAVESVVFMRGAPKPHGPPHTQL